jgi:hypothetical protein
MEKVHIRAKFLMMMTAKASKMHLMMMSKVLMQKHTTIVMTIVMMTSKWMKMVSSLMERFTIQETPNLKTPAVK